MTPPFGPLRRALVRRPTEAVDSPEMIRRFGYRRAQSLVAAQSEHEALVRLLSDAGVQVEWHDEPLPGLADAIYVCDPALITPHGAIMLRMGKRERRGEPAALERRLVALGVPILGRIVAPGCVEGGDCLWLDDVTLAVGEGYRTNPDGIAQLRALLPDREVLAIPLPHHHGPAECLHLQSLLSFAGPGLAVVHLPVAPVRLVRALEARRVRLLPLPPQELDSLGSNVLCLAPGRVILPGGNPGTAALLRAEGIDVAEIEAPDLMWVGTGGPTCLTLPLERGGPPAG